MGGFQEQMQETLAKNQSSGKRPGLQQGLNKYQLKAEQ
jgi:hypothetical protein